MAMRIDVHWHFVDYGNGRIERLACTRGELCLWGAADPKELAEYIKVSYENPDIASWLARRRNDSANQEKVPFMAYTREGKYFEEINDEVARKIVTREIQTVKYVDGERIVTGVSLYERFEYSDNNVCEYIVIREDKE